MSFSQLQLFNPAADVVGPSRCCPADFTVRDNSPRRAIPTSESLPAMSPRERRDATPTATASASAASASASGGVSNGDRLRSCAMITAGGGGRVPPLTPDVHVSSVQLPAQRESRHGDGRSQSQRPIRRATADPRLLRLC